MRITEIKPKKIDSANDGILRRFRDYVVGHDDEVAAISDLMTVGLSGLAAPGRPIFSTILSGPSGCGKTHTAKSLALAMHHSENAVLRIDCGEFQMEHEIAKLIGAPPGYLGHRETVPMLSQQTLAAVTSDGCGFSVVLFDEIEKASKSLMRILLGILDTASLKLGDGNSVNFERSCIFFTSNLGHGQKGQIGLGCTSQREKTTAAIRGYFSSEFLNRIDVVMRFEPLSKKEVLEVVKREFEKAVRRYESRQHNVEIAPSVAPLIAEMGYSEEYGAREVKRTIEREITLKIARLGANNVRVSTKRGKIIAEAIKSKAA